MKYTIIFFVLSFFGYASLFGQNLDKPPFPPERLRPECCDLSDAYAVYAIALGYYAKEEGLKIENKPNWEMKYPLLRDFTITLPSGRVLNILNDFKDMGLAAKDIDGINDVPSALGILAQAHEFIVNFNVENCNSTCTAPNADITEKLRRFKENFAIYGGDMERKWQKDDRTGFMLIDSLLKVHFNVETLKRATQFQSIIRNKQAVVMVVNLDELDDKTYNDHVLIKGDTLKNFLFDNELPVCPTERYYEQMSLNSLGTGFFIAKGMVATTAHLFGDGDKLCEEIKIGNIRFITGVELPLKVTAGGVLVPKQNVFKPAAGANAVIGAGNCKQTDGADWALIKVKPAYKSGTAKYTQSVVNAGVLKDSAYLYAFGHGLGLPLKFAFDARSSPSQSNWNSCFVGDLDMFGGNSGSPVFNAKTHELIGFLKSGEIDFGYDKNSACLKYNQKNSGQYGEQIQYVEIFSPALIRNGYRYFSSVPKATKRNKFLNKPESKRQGYIVDGANSRTETKRDTAPYLYLHRNAQNTYTVCVLVPAKTNQETIRLDSTNIHAQRATYYYSMQPSLIVGDTYARDIQQLNTPLDSGASVKVVIKAKARDYVGMLNVNNADTARLTIKNNLALYAPYTYLAKEKSNGTVLFFPYLLIPVENQSLQSEVAEQENAVNFKSAIVLQSAPNTGLGVLLPPVTNYTIYTAQSSQEGYFTATVDAPSFADKPPTKSKTVHPNRGADEKPNKKKAKPKAKK